MITNIPFIQPTNFQYSSPVKHNKISFGHNIPTLTHTNIGSCAEGYIGKIRVRKDNGEAFLNVFKKFLGENVENYTIKNDKNEIIGNANIFIIKCPPNPWDKVDPSYVMVDDLRNFSKPNTPYHDKNLEYFKDIGTRLLQIAQRRSDEACCQGNVKLISVNEALAWYKNIIGMRQEFPPIPGQKFNIHNPNLLYLPPENKEPLSRLQGGL